MSVSGCSDRHQWYRRSVAERLKLRICLAISDAPLDRMGLERRSALLEFGYSTRCTVERSLYDSIVEQLVGMARSGNR